MGCVTVCEHLILLHHISKTQKIKLETDMAGKLKLTVVVGVNKDLIGQKKGRWTFALINTRKNATMRSVEDWPNANQAKRGAERVIGQIVAADRLDTVSFEGTPVRKARAVKAAPAKKKPRAVKLGPVKRRAPRSTARRSKSNAASTASVH